MNNIKKDTYHQCTIYSNTYILMHQSLLNIHVFFDTNKISVYSVLLQLLFCNLFIKYFSTFNIKCIFTTHESYFSSTPKCFPKKSSNKYTFKNNLFYYDHDNKNKYNLIKHEIKNKKSSNI